MKSNRITTLIAAAAILVAGLPAQLLGQAWTASGPNLNWGSTANWSSGMTPDSSSYLYFSDLLYPDAPTNAVGLVNTVVEANYTAGGLLFDALSGGSAGFVTNHFYTTLIPGGVTLTVDGGAPGPNGEPMLLVGDWLRNSGSTTNYSSFVGAGTLYLNNPAGRMEVRQVPRATLDLSGLDNFIANLGGLSVGAAVNVGSQTGVLLLGKTNTITTAPSPTVPGILLGRGASGAVSGQMLLGSANNLNTDALVVGGNRGNGGSPGSRLNFNPAAANPSVKLRGSAGGSTRASIFSIGDISAQEDGFVALPGGNAAGIADFTGGTADLLADAVYVGRSAGDTEGGPNGNFTDGTGTLTLDNGTLDANNLYVGYKQGTNNSRGVGTVNLKGTANATVNGLVSLAFRNNLTNGSQAATATLNVNDSAVLNVGGNIVHGDGGVSTINLGGGTINLSGGGSVYAYGLNGAGTINGASTITVTNNFTPGSASTAGTLNLSGNLSLANPFPVTFNLGPNATTGGGVNDHVNVTGDVSFNNNPLAVTFNGPLLSGSTYHLIDFTGNRSGALTFANVTRSELGLDQSTPGHVDLIVTNWNPATLTWVGSTTLFPSNNVWNASDTNWSNGGSPDRFFQMDHVVFDDSAVSTNIYPSGALYPASITINGSKSFSITNRSTAGGFAGSLNGSGTLTKNGTGTLLLGAYSNIMTGDIIINNGVLRPFDPTFTTPGNNNVLGATNATSILYVNAGGTFDVNNIGSISSGKRFVIQGSGFNGMGAITNSGTAAGATMNGYFLTLAGDTMVAAQNGGWGIRGLASSGSFYSGQLNLQGYTLTKLGSHRFAIQDVLATDAGSINFGGGHFQIQNSVLTGAGSLNFSNNTWVQFAYAAGATSYVAKAINTFGSFGLLTPATGNQPGQVLIDSALTLGGPLAITNNQTLIHGGAISGAFGLTKYGNSNLVLTAANTYSGNTLITAGTLALGAGGSVNQSPQLVINPGATLDVSAQAGSYAIAAGQTLTLNGAAIGDVTVGANSTLLGAGVINGSLTLASNGEIALGTTNVTGTTTVAGNLNLNGGHLTWELAPSFEISDALVVNGDLNLSGTNIFTVNSIGGFDPSGMNTLITYSGAFTGGLTNLAVNSAARFVVEFVDPALTPGRIQIRLLTPSPTLTWKGGDAGGPRNWDTKVTPNWDNGGSPDVFWSSDLVRFDDTASTNVVNLVGTLGPGSVAMENSAASYFFGGAGGLVSSSLTNTTGSLTFSNTANNFFTGVGLVLNGGDVTFAQPVHATLSANLNGSGSFIKAGTSNLTLTGNAANYSGPMYVNAGTLRAGSSNVLGAGSTTVAAGAALDVNGQPLISSSVINVAGAGADGWGAINNRGPARTNAVANVSLTGNTTFGALSNAWGIVNSLLGGGFSLTKTNAQDVWIMTGSETDLGDIDVRQGRLVFSAAGTTMGRPANSVTVRPNAVLALATTNAMPNSGAPPDALNVGVKPIILSSGAILESIGFPVNQTSVDIHEGPIAIATNGHFRVGGNSRLVLNGPISGNGQLIVTNNGTLHLNGTNTYGSNTLVYSGTLVLSNSASLPATTSLLVSNPVSAFGNPGLVLENGPVFPATSLLHVSTRNSSAGVGGDGTWNGPIFLFGSNTFSFSGGTTLLDLAGPLITTNAGGTVTFHGSKTRLAGSLVLNGPATAVTIGVGDGLGAGFDERFTTVRLDGSNFWNSTTIDRGRVILGAHNALPPAAPIRVGTLAAGVMDRRITFDLAGHNQTISSLTETAVGDSLVVVGNSSEVADSLLTYAGTGTNTWGVQIVDDLDAPAVPRKTGLKVTSGTLNLGRSHTYTGPTTISGGTLNLIIGTGLLAGQVGELAESVVTVNGTGTLGGNGRVAGPVTVSEHGALSPGMSIGSLTMENTLTLNGGRVLCEVNLATGTNDQVVGITTLTLGGTLVITNVGSQPFTNGTVIKVFDAASYVAGPVNVQPGAPGDGLMWDTTQLATHGSLRVVPVTPLVVAGAARLADGNVSFTIAGALGQGYTIRASTDIGAPIATWPVVQTGTITTTPMVFTDLSATNHPQRFYSTSTP